MESFNHPHTEKPPLYRSHTSHAELSPPKNRQDHSKRSHLHYPYHRHHHHRDKDKPAPQSAILPSNNANSADWTVASTQSLLTKGVGISPAGSRDHSRRPSLHIDDGEEKENERTSLEKMRKRNRTTTEEQQLAREKERQKSRNEELKASLSSLSTLATDTTRRLDTIYYSILERLSTLQSTISTLQELSSRTSTLHHDFQEDADELIKDVNDQINSLDTSGASQSRIEDLENRIRRGRENVFALGQRLENVRQRVENSVRNEEKWQAQASRRLRMLWGGIAIVVLLFIVLLVVQHARIPSKRDDDLDGLRRAFPKQEIEARLKRFTAFENALSSLDASGSFESKPWPRTDDSIEDPRLKIFDEL